MHCPTRARTVPPITAAIKNVSRKGFKISLYPLVWGGVGGDFLYS